MAVVAWMVTMPVDPSTVTRAPFGMVADAPVALDDGRDAELAGHDRRVALLRTDVHDHARGREEERRPGRIGDRRDEDVARTQVTGLVGARHDSRGAGGNARAHAHADDGAGLRVGALLLGAERPGRWRRDLALEPERWHACLQVLASTATVVEIGRPPATDGQRLDLGEREQEEVVVGEP